MLTRNLVLLSLKALGGRISGKTAFLKKLYFLEIFLKEDLGYFPHYYGPYSSEVAAGITQLKNLGLIREKALHFSLPRHSDFETRRYEYELTEEGSGVVDLLKKLYPNEAGAITTCIQKIQDAGDLDYMDLSLAAKAFMILRPSNRPMTNSEIAAEAHKFAWTVDDGQVQRAIDFLDRLGLVSPNAPEPARIS